MFTVNPGHTFASADCNKEKGSHRESPLWLCASEPRDCSSTNEKHLLERAAMCAEGFSSRSGIFFFFFARRSHDREEHYSGTEKPASCSSSLFGQEGETPPLEDAISGDAPEMVNAVRLSRDV